MAETKHHLLGIGIDEQLQWATAEANSMGIIDSTIKCHAEPYNDDLPLGKQLSALCDNLIGKDPTVFERAHGIGISTSGVIDSEKHRIVYMARKRGFSNAADGSFYFDKFFREKLRKVFDPAKLIVHNETSAGAMAEFVWGSQSGRISGEIRRLLYLRIDEGVNGGIIQIGERVEQPPASRGNFLPSPRNPEIGHVRPRRHELDFHFPKEFSGCPSHTDCYEGIASGARIRKEWGGRSAPKSFSLGDLPINHPMWEIEAEYVAQLALTCVLMLSPELILIGGLIGGNDHLVQMVKERFEQQNNKHFRYDAMKGNFIRRATFGPEVTVFGALQVALRAAQGLRGKPFTPTIVPFPPKAERR